MKITIKEENGFMPDTIIRISDKEIELEENDKTRKLNYNEIQIKEIIRIFLDLTKYWKEKYIEKSIIDDDTFVITIEGVKEYYIKNKYPNNWGSFISFRNKLIREEIKTN